MVKISALMSVYNGERHLAQAVESILNQTFTDFQFIIIDDGSTDGTRAILESYGDSRIVLIYNQENMGLPRSLNRGLALAQGEYVARIDADDVAMPHRFERQIAFLEKHPEIGILGSACQLIDTNGREQGFWRMPPNDLQIRWKSLLATPFCHPTVMMRRDVLTQNGLKYDEALLIPEDYDLWTRMLKYTRGANLSEPLIQYRLGYGVTSALKETLLKNHDMIALRTIQEQLPGFAITREQVSQLRALFAGVGESMSGLDTQRMTLVEIYWDMLEAFMSQHYGDSGLKALQRQEAWRVARLVLHPPPQPGWMRVIQRLIAADPGLPWYFGSRLLSAGIRRLRLYHV